MAAELIIGAMLIATGAVLIFIALPHNGEPARFLHFPAVVVLYPPLIETVLIVGAAELISGCFEMRP